MQLGQRIGPFTVDKELGAGAMGSVYRGRHAETGQRVAIKIIAPGLAGNATAMARFKREASILRQLKHPHIVRLVATGTFQGTPFYAMEYVEGESLDHVMARRGRVSWEEVVALGKQLCDALNHAHQQGIIHRDLKPSNLMVLADGTIKLTDFGIAKDLDETSLTSANCTVGTAAYMSPEQCRGERNISHKSDLYSMGVMFYELVTGQKPFNAESAMEMFMQHAKGPFERPSRMVLDIPVWLDTLICQLMEKKPDQRPFDAAMVSAALDRVQEKVEAQVSAGVDTLRSQATDRLSNRPRLDEDDKAAARELLGVKKKKKRKGPAWYQRRWVHGIGMATLLAMILGVVSYALLYKPPPEFLFDQASKVFADENSTPEQKRRVRKEAVAQYLSYYSDLPGAEQMRAWADEVDRDELEELLSFRWGAQTQVGLDDEEREVRKAFTAEQQGRMQDAREAWQKLLRYKDVSDAEKRPYGLLAAKRLRELEKR